MDGIIIVNKPKEYTSHDVVAVVKKKLGEKVGHTGTLDPNATGVLPLLIGKGTKISKYLIEHDKIYEAVIKLGVKTDTADSEGKVIEETDVEDKSLNEENVKAVIQNFKGVQEQIPPIYSAIKIKGKKLYDYARNKEEVEIPKRTIEIYDIKLDKILKEQKEIHFTVHCSKGTYIRSLCEDIAKKLGTIGYMKELNRKSVGRFKIEDSISVEEVKKLQVSEIESKMISIEDLFKDKEIIELNNRMYELFQNGVCLNSKELKKKELTDDIYRIYNNDKFVGLGIAKDNKIKRDLII